MSSMLLVFGACRGPFLFVEVGVVGDQGIVDNCPISRHNRQLPLGCAALVRFVVAVAVVGGETNPL